MNIEYDLQCSGRLSRQKTQQGVLDVGNKLGADRDVVTGADRTRAVHDAIYAKISPKDKVQYENSYHSSCKGYRAADVKYYRAGAQITPFRVSQTAKNMSTISGTKTYATFTHITVK